MPLFKKKPVVIEAVLFTGYNCLECLRFMGQGALVDSCLELHETDCPVIHTPEGTMNTIAGDWIIKGVKDEFYPCHNHIFNLTYEAVE